MEITFATKCLATAEKYINESDWQELKDNKEKVLKAVKDGLIRICDPLMYGSVKISTGDNWYKKHQFSTNEEAEKAFRNYVYEKLLKGKF